MVIRILLTLLVFNIFALATNKNDIDISNQLTSIKMEINKMSQSLGSIKVAQKNVNKPNLNISKRKEDAADKKISSLIEKLHKEELEFINNKFMRNTIKMQKNYQDAIHGTNDNLTMMGILLTTLGIIAALIGFYFQYSMNKDQNRYEKEMDDKLKTLHSEIQQATISELHLATIEIQKIHQYQHRLFYALNKELATNLSRKGAIFEEEYSRFNDSYLRIIDLTSLEHKKMITAIKELGVPSLNAISWKYTLKEYLEHLKEYDSDIKLREAINVLLAKL